MPVWNGERYLEAAMDSIFAQTLREFEFVVVDDGSTDGTLGILAKCTDPRLHVVRLEHGGIVTALNTGVANAKAELIARMDADDIAHPERLERQCAAMATNLDAVLCHTNIERIGEFAAAARPPHFPRTRALIAAQLCFRSPIVHPTVMFRKGAFLAAGGYLPEERHAEDFGLWGRLIHQGALIGLPEKLLQFRVHAQSISKQQSAAQLALNDSIATRHCREFLRLDQTTAERAYRAFGGMSKGAFQEWIWVATQCLPHLRRQSFELWLWAASQALRRLLKS
jgi:glycosyltransferase involved in cell wall biosynthesis